MRMPRQLDPTSRLLNGRPYLGPSGSRTTPPPQDGADPDHPVRRLLDDAGMPAERAARIAARLAFVDMKRSFMQAADRIHGLHGDRVRRKVRQATDPIELFHLREVVSALLPDDARDMRQQLRLKLRTVFSDTMIGSAPER
jgi:hypothetical protein